MIRKSVQSDLEQILELMHLCFGDRDTWITGDITNRFYLKFIDSKLVAMSGIIDCGYYTHPEIDWTCTHPDYRHNGYMQELFTEMFKHYTGPVYCSCWRLPSKERINLYSIMKMFNFREIINVRVHWKAGHNCLKNENGGCVNYTGIGCECYEDLYLRDGNSFN